MDRLESRTNFIATLNDLDIGTLDRMLITLRRNQYEFETMLHYCGIEDKYADAYSINP